MEVYPAIDIRSGRVVRLSQPDAAPTVRTERDPVALAERFVWQGARWLHIVDLDKVFGDGDNSEVIGRIITRVGSFVQIQLAGGFRTLERVREVADLEVARVVLGSMAVTESDFVPAVMEVLGRSRVAVGLDVRDGRVCLRGWHEASTIPAIDVAHRVAQQGIRTLVYTDVSRDGMLTGADVPGALALQDSGAGVIASGGIGALGDLITARDAGLAGVVVGRAFFENRFGVAEAVALAAGD